MKTNILSMLITTYVVAIASFPVSAGEWISLVDIQNTIGNTTKENGTVVLNAERESYIFDKIRVDYSQTSSGSSCYLTIDYADTKSTALEIATNNISGYYVNEDRNSYTSVATLKTNGALIGESVYEYDLNSICNTTGKSFYARLWQINFLPGQIEVYVSSENISDCTVASGRCGDNLLWLLSCDSVLTITGTGAMWENMWDSVGNSSPWSDYNDQIAAYAIGDGITYLNEESFNHDVQTIRFNGTIEQWIDKQWDPTQMAYKYYLYINGEKLVDLVIPNDISRLKENVFNGCISLQSVSVPTSVYEWGNNAFNNCDSLKAVYITNLENWCKIKCNTFSGNPLHAAKHLYLNNSEIIGELVIPNTIDSVGNWSFVNCIGITSVVIPEGVHSIGEGSFNTCKNITSISMPNTLKSIGFAAFLACEKLQNLIIPDSVEMIDQYAFRNCYNLESVTLGKDLIEIGNWSFSDCHKLSTIICHENLQRIGSIAFGYDSLLSTIEIPRSVTYIGEVAFYDCVGLTSITCHAVTPPTLGNNVFINVDKSIPLYVPAESIDAYKSADQWSDFTNILPIPAASVAITANEDPQHTGTYYSTFYYSSGNYELPATGVEAFVATISGSDMNLTRIAGGAGVIPQGTAVILRSTIASYTFTLSDDASVFDGTNVLQGVDEATATPANCYVLSAVDGMVGFYQYTGEQVGAHKAYLVYSGAQGNAPRRMRFVFDEENAATGVDVMEQPYMDVLKRIENGQLIIEANGVRYNAEGQIVK